MAQNSLTGSSPVLTENQQNVRFYVQKEKIFNTIFFRGKMKSILGVVITFGLFSSHCIYADSQEIGLQRFSGIPILSQNQLIDRERISEVVKDGIFYLEMPHECKVHVDDALEFCYRFPNDEKIKEYTDGKFGGYHNREYDQIESFYVEKRDWGKVLPTSLQQLAFKMAHLTKILLQTTLVNSAIPKELWSEGTGLLTDDGGQNHFSFNHYRCEKEAMGIKPHQDFGFVTILFVEKAGLEAYYKGQWEEVPPLKDHFVVILGRAFEILVNDQNKVSGAFHRVSQLLEERASFAISCDNDENRAVKRYLKESNQLETVYESYHDYLAERFKQTYPQEGR